MPHVLIRHRVEDYARWKPAFDKHASVRMTAGELRHMLFRTADDPNDIFILFEWDRLDKAQQFVRSEDLRKVMQQAGVADQPDIYFLDKIA